MQLPTLIAVTWLVCLPFIVEGKKAKPKPKGYCAKPKNLKIFAPYTAKSKGKLVAPVKKMCLTHK